MGWFTMMIRSFLDRGEEVEVGWGGVVYHGQRLLRQRGGSGGRKGWGVLPWSAASCDSSCWSPTAAATSHGAYQSLVQLLFSSFPHIHTAEFC